MNRLRSSRGQLLLPLLGMFFCMVLGMLLLIREGRNHIHRMRLDLAADAVTLSHARAQAGMLSTISLLNEGGNACYVKENIPGLKEGIAQMYVRQVNPFLKWNVTLRNAVKFYSAMPNGVAYSVAKANRVKTLPLLPVTPHLIPQGIHTAIIIHPWPPLFVYKYFDSAYYARGWSTGRAKAQPPHKSMWMVWDSHGKSAGAARVWLDVDLRSLTHNGGFPRPGESGFRGLGVQSAHPQFSARLLPRPNWTAVLNLLSRLGEIV